MSPWKGQMKSTIDVSGNYSSLAPTPLYGANVCAQFSTYCVIAYHALEAIEVLMFRSTRLNEGIIDSVIFKAATATSCKSS